MRVFAFVALTFEPICRYVWRDYRGERVGYARFRVLALGSISEGQVYNNPFGHGRIPASTIMQLVCPSRDCVLLPIQDRSLVCGLKALSRTLNNPKP